MSSAGRIFDGTSWTDVQASPTASFRGSQRPVSPNWNGDGKIHVAIPSFRDGARCAQTLIDLFEKAQDPDSIIVGLVEQNYEENDPFCLEMYCKQASEGKNLEIYKRQTIRKDTVKVIAKEQERSQCPRIDQIRKMAVHNVAAKGPSWARSLGRKLLGNEEFCLQIDAHSLFVEHWDQLLKEEWKSANNEFAILSHPPPATSEYDRRGENAKTVPRGCSVDFLEVLIPHFDLRGDGKVENLQTPLLSHTWSPGFSFAKCHLEESAPYDGFTPYVAGVEAFARYARFWTRGYDVYTPTQNIVYSNYSPNPDGHDVMEWMKPWKQRLRNKSLDRIRTYLELPTAVDENLKLDNLGIYGLGKRRTLKQLDEFVGIDLVKQQSRPSTLPCGNFQWIPYDAGISPVDNLYSHPDDLDPQPDFPLRTQMTFFKEIEDVGPDLEVLVGDLHPAAQGSPQQAGDTAHSVANTSDFPSFLLIFLFWIFGLLGWCYYAVMTIKASKSGKKRRKGPSDKTTYKDK